MSAQVEKPIIPSSAIAVEAASGRSDALEASKSYRVWVVAFLAIGFLPLLSWHFYELLKRPHYQFALLIPVAAWLLSIGEAEQEKSAGTWRNRWLIGSLVPISLIGLGLATNLWSPWLAAVSFFIMLPALIWLLGGMAKLNQWFRGWVLCWMMIPLPFGLDEDLIVNLRTITTRLTSSVLDQFQLLHLQYGNVIEVPGKQLFIADACSGIHSLYVLLAAALFIGLWLSRGIIHILLLLAGAFFLVILENVSRLFLIVAMLKYQVDLSVGIEHMILGGSLFVASLLILISLDQLILFITTSKKSETQAAWFKWNGTKTKEFVPQRLEKNTFRFFTIGAVAAGLLGIIQIYKSHGEVPDFAGLSYEEIDLPEFGLQGLPKTIAGFERADYKTIARVPGDPFGQASQQWTYEKDGVTILLAIDYPYNGIHDLCVCYSNIGWAINEKRILTEEEVRVLNPEASNPIAVGKLSRDLYGHGLLAFSFFDLQGNSSAVIKELAEQSIQPGFEGRFGNKNQKGKKYSLSPPFIEIQILARHSDLVDPHQEQELLKFFIEARKLLTKLCLDELKDR